MIPSGKKVYPSRQYIQRSRHADSRRPWSITQSVKQQVAAANRARHKAERKLARTVEQQKPTTVEDNTPIRVMIVCSGGITKSVLSNRSVMYANIDLDEAPYADGFLVSVGHAEEVEHDMKLLYRDTDLTDSDAVTHRRIYEELARQNF
jgi:hypothetical protein